MPEPTEWYRNIEAGIGPLKTQLGSANARYYNLDRLLKIARRVDEFAPNCPKCQELQTEIERMLRDLKTYTPQEFKQQKRVFFRDSEALFYHLQKAHGIISEGQYTGALLALGAGMGVALGAGFNNLGFGIPVGTAAGLIIGIILDDRAKKAGKML